MMGLSSLGPSFSLGPFVCMLFSLFSPCFAAEGPSAAGSQVAFDSLPTVAEARADDWNAREHARDIKTDAFLPFYNTLTATNFPETSTATTPFISQEKTRQAAPEDAREGGTAEREPVDGGADPVAGDASLNSSLTSARRPPFARIARLPAALACFLALFVGLGFIAYQRKPGPTPSSVEFPVVEAWPPEEELTDKLSALEGLLPLAQEFAKVADTAESEGQVAQVRLDLQRARMARPTDSIKMLGFLEKAEEALKKLRQAVLAKADAIIQDPGAPRIDGVVQFIKQLEGAPLTHSQAKTLSPFTYVLKAVHSQFEELTGAMEEVRSHLEGDTCIDGEVDESALEAFREDMGLLLKLQQARRSLVEHAAEQQSGAAGALGLVMTQGLVRDLIELHGSIDLAEVYHDIASTSAAEGAARVQVDERLESFVLQGQVSQSKRELAQLLEETAMISMQKDPAIILARAQALGAAHKKLYSSVVDCWEDTVKQLRIPAALAPRPLERVKAMIKASLQRVSQEGITVLDLVKTALGEVRKVAGCAHADLQYVRVFENLAFERMAKGSISTLLALQANAEGRVSAVSSLLDSLTPGIGVNDAAAIMEKAANIAAASAADLSEARVQCLSIHSLVGITLHEREHT